MFVCLGFVEIISSLYFLPLAAKFVGPQTGSQFLKNVNCSDRILTCRIKSIRSPAKGGTGCYRFNYQPGS